MRETPVIVPAPTCGEENSGTVAGPGGCEDEINNAFRLHRSPVPSPSIPDASLGVSPLSTLQRVATDSSTADAIALSKTMPFKPPSPDGLSSGAWNRSREGSELAKKRVCTPGEEMMFPPAERAVATAPNSLLAVDVSNIEVEVAVEVEKLTQEQGWETPTPRWRGIHTGDKHLLTVTRKTA